MADADAMKVRVLERDYDLAPPLTNRELHIIKQVAGVRAGEIWDAIEAGDNDVNVAFAHIAVRRTGAPRPSLDELWELPADAINVSPPVEEDEDPTTPPDGGESEQGGGQETTPSPAGDGSSEPIST